MSCSVLEENVPKVLISDKIVDDSYVDYLAKMMNVCDNTDVNKVLAIILAKLGLKKDDVVTISNVSQSSYDAVRTELLVNGQPAFDVLFHRRYGRNCLGVALTDSKKDHYMYKCDVSKSVDEKISVNMFLKDYDVGKKDNLVVCRREYDSFSYSTFSATSPGGRIKQQLSLNVKCSDEDAKLNRESGKYLTPRNEKLLITYLKSRSYPIKLDDVFKVVKELSFDGDLSSYPNFDLYVCTGRKHSNGEDREKTDIISLNNGKLIKFGLMHTGELHDCNIKNSGATVEFIGSGGMRYYSLVPRKGINYLGVFDISTDDSNVSSTAVREVGEKLVSIFPEAAERMLDGKLIENAPDTDQLSLFDNLPKQMCKQNGEN